ncbi:MAG: hypothetical protein ACI4XL_11785 [Bacillus sp. (in: firmicutes)]
MDVFSLVDFTGVEDIGYVGNDILPFLYGFLMQHDRHFTFISKGTLF